MAVTILRPLLAARATSAAGVQLESSVLHAAPRATNLPYYPELPSSNGSSGLRLDEVQTSHRLAGQAFIRGRAIVKFSRTCGPERRVGKKMIYSVRQHAKRE